jgi:membrane-bound lytic murein transglycosylase MltF
MPPITLEAADENLADEDLLEMVNAGLLPLTVVDEFKAKVWAKVFDHLTVRDDLVVNSGGEVAWAIRKQRSPELLAVINEFVKGHTEGTSFGNIIKHRYFGETKIIKNAYSPEDAKKFHHMLKIFKQYGGQYSFDYLMIAAQGYQESQLEQWRRSPYGAVGIMQILPSTAAAEPISIVGVESDADRNIHAGFAYMRYLVDTYISDPAIDEKNRTLMAFAAYNAGPGNLARFREIAKQDGKDPNVWFDNVENGAAQVVGQQTVQYVSNIYKYYIAYHLLGEREAAEERAQHEERRQNRSGSA